MGGAVFVPYNRHNSSLMGFREKDPGYVGIRANKDLWWDQCTESNTSFYVLFHYQRRSESVADMARDASTQNPQSFLLVSCKLSEVFENELSPSKRQISNRHACTLTL